MTTKTKTEETCSTCGVKLAACEKGMHDSICGKCYSSFMRETAKTRLTKAFEEVLDAVESARRLGVQLPKQAVSDLGDCVKTITVMM
ncbi:MAG: hypothetical protein JRL30_00975 [Deltaproteobacteria bacterium]|nr:hypothetical protein [Deltaproteobacteria bacterium]